MSSIFLSHNHADKPFVRRLAQDLQGAGVRIWLDEAELLIGDSLIEKIREGIDQMDYLGVILSKSSVQSEWVKREVDIAMNQEIKGKRVKVLPLVIEDCELPGFLEGKLYADFRDPERYDEELGKVLCRVLFNRPSLTTIATLLEPSFTNTLGMEFVLIPAGIFLMGTPIDQLDAIAGGAKGYRDWIAHEAPPHQVEISRPFYLGKYPVTQAQWQALMGDNPSRFKGDNLPVETVSWNEVQAFIKKLNEREGVDLYRLPTEAEWEYVCRAGSTGLYSCGDEVSRLGDYAWYGENSGGTTHPVGEKKPNTWGLYDMHGNVWEWVEDVKRAYTAHAVTDPKASTDAGARRVYRGGSWDVPALVARSAYRPAYHPGRRSDGIGFRCLSSGVSQ